MAVRRLRNLGSASEQLLRSDVFAEPGAGNPLLPGSAAENAEIGRFSAQMPDVLPGQRTDDARQTDSGALERHPEQTDGILESARPGSQLADAVHKRTFWGRLPELRQQRTGRTRTDHDEHRQRMAQRRSRPAVGARQLDIRQRSGALHRLGDEKPRHIVQQERTDVRRNGSRHDGLHDVRQHPVLPRRADVRRNGAGGRQNPRSDGMDRTGRPDGAGDPRRILRRAAVEPGKVRIFPRPVDVDLRRLRGLRRPQRRARSMVFALRQHLPERYRPLYRQRVLRAARTRIRPQHHHADLDAARPERRLRPVPDQSFETVLQPAAAEAVHRTGRRIVQP